MVTIHSITLAVLPFISHALGQACATISPANPATFAPGFGGRVVVNGLKG